MVSTLIDKNNYIKARLKAGGREISKDKNRANDFFHKTFKQKNKTKKA